MLSIPQQGERTMSKQKKNKKPDWLKTTWQMKQTLRQSKYIEDTLNDVFSRHMPDLQPGEELGMGFGKERILNETNYVDCENKELEDVYLPPSNPEVQKRLMEIMLTRTIKPKGETKLKKSLKRLTNHVYREYGARCDDYEPTCIVCKTWACIDHLKETIKLKGETK